LTTQYLIYILVLKSDILSKGKTNNVNLYIRGVTMLARERRDEILSFVQSKGSVKTSELIKRYNVSLETIRRDLDLLEKKTLLQRVYGGAVQTNLSRRYKDFDMRIDEYSSQKKEIAKKALPLIKNGQAIALDTGTTNLELARMLKGQFNDLTIVTNSLIIAEELIYNQEFNIILVGGEISTKDYSTHGIIAEKVLDFFNFDINFLTVSGISLKSGITEYNLDAVQILKKMNDCSQKTIVLADNRKFNSTSMFKVCDLSSVNLIISDSELDESIKQKFMEQGIEVI